MTLGALPLSGCGCCGCICVLDNIDSSDDVLANWVISDDASFATIDADGVIVVTSGTVMHKHPKCATNFWAIWSHRTAEPFFTSGAWEWLIGATNTAGDGAWVIRLDYGSTVVGPGYRMSLVDPGGSRVASTNFTLAIPETPAFVEACIKDGWLATVGWGQNLWAASVGTLGSYCGVRVTADQPMNLTSFSMGQNKNTADDHEGSLSPCACKDCNGTTLWPDSSTTSRSFEGSTCTLVLTGSAYDGTYTGPLTAFSTLDCSADPRYTVTNDSGNVFSVFISGTGRFASISGPYGIGGAATSNPFSLTDGTVTADVTVAFV